MMDRFIAEVYSTKHDIISVVKFIPGCRLNGKVELPDWHSLDESSDND